MKNTLTLRYRYYAFALCLCMSIAVASLAPTDSQAQSRFKTPTAQAQAQDGPPYKYPQKDVDQFVKSCSSGMKQLNGPCNCIIEKAQMQFSAEDITNMVKNGQEPTDTEHYMRFAQECSEQYTR